MAPVRRADGGVNDGLRGRGGGGARHGALHFLVDGRRHFDIGADLARRQDDGVFAERLAHLREHGSHVLADESLDTHRCSSWSYLLPTAVTIRTLRLSGT